MKKDNIRMQINIAGEPISLTVPFDQQELVRDTERSVGELFDKWKDTYRNRSTQHILAMIAYQYASYFFKLCHNYEEGMAALKEIDDKLNKVLQPLA